MASILGALFFTFLAVVIIQLVYYGIVFTRFAFAKSQTPTRKNIAVSVIICCKNEAENLRRFLPSVLEQDHPNFEIILINDDSTDETLKIMNEFAQRHHNIKVVDVKSIEAFWGNKKYALTLGIKVASHDFLLFTDADCRPVSSNWISEISRRFTNDHSIVIGYGAYRNQKPRFLNKLIRFETLLAAVQYFSYAKLGMPYMAVGRNLAYRKDEFFNAGGYINHMKIRSGDDDLFINQVANAKNTTVCFSKDSFTESIPETDFKSWIHQKRRHYSTSRYYKPVHKFVLGLFYLSQLLFWLLGIVLLAFLHHWEIVAGAMVLRLALQYVVIGSAASKLKETGLLVLLPVLELFLICTQFFIFIANQTSKPVNWR